MTPAKTAPKTIPLSKARWYELDRLIPYRDLFLAGGFLIGVAGVAILSVAAALIVAGILIGYFGYCMAER